MKLDTLDGFPCYYGAKDYPCSAGCRDRVATGEWTCSNLPIFRAHVATRKAILGEMTAAKAAEMYRKVARLFAKCIPNKGGAQAHFNALADVAGKLDEYPR